MLFAQSQFHSTVSTNSSHSTQNKHLMGIPISQLHRRKQPVLRRSAAHLFARLTGYYSESSCENPNAPTLFDYHWFNGRWESRGEYPFQCKDGRKITATRFDFLKPNGDGSFVGERTFTVIGSGCHGEGPGKYWLPFTLISEDFKNSTLKIGNIFRLCFVKKLSIRFDKI